MEAVTSFGGWGVAIINLVLNLPGHWSGGEFLLHAPYWNLSRRSSGGEIFLHAPCWNLSRRLARGEFVFHTLSDGICLFVWRVVGLIYKPCVGVSQVVRLLGRLCYTSG